MPKVFISTAEPSAERHASHLVKELLATVPDLRVDAAGGDILAGVGADVAVNMSGRAVMGFWEALSQLSFYKRAGEDILARLERDRHDALILVDAPSFHLRLAKKAHAKWPKLPILYYIAPKLWAWKEWRIKNLKRDITRTLCIFPFEVDFFRKRGVDAVFVGNPTRDQIRSVSGVALAESLGVKLPEAGDDPARGLLAIFPGSRNSEIKYLWPLMVNTIGLLRQRFPELAVAVALAPGMNAAKLARYAPLPEGVRLVERSSQELLAASSAVLAKSGTTTLEAALLGKPMAVFYAAHFVTAIIGWLFVKLPYVSLPNILAGRGLVKEFIQYQATPENLAGEIGALLSDPGYYGRMRSDLLALRDTLGDEPAAARAAREVASFLR